MTRSRRQYLRSAAGLVGVGAASGCLDVLSGSEPAFLSYKGIEVQWGDDRVQGYVADLCWLWSDGHNRIFGWQPQEYPDIVASPTDVTVSAATDGRLRDRFNDVGFVVGFSRVETTDLSLLESNLGLVGVSREQFNRIQFDDRIDVSTTDAGVRIRDVTKGGHQDPSGWTVTIGTKNLVTQFPDKGVPEPN